MSVAPSHEQSPLAMPCYGADPEADEAALAAGLSDFVCAEVPVTSGGFAIPAASSDTHDDSDGREHAHGDVSSVVVGEDLAE